MNTYSPKRRAWSDRYIPAIKRIVGPYLLEESSIQVDTEECADLVVMMGRDVTIACRIRNLRYYDRYPYDITIRGESGGRETEYDKIVAGWGDWMFYGFGDCDLNVPHWRIIDLRSVRELLMRQGPQVLAKKVNGDGVTELFALDVEEFDVRHIAKSYTLDVPF